MYDEFTVGKQKVNGLAFPVCRWGAEMPFYFFNCRRGLSVRLKELHGARRRCCGVRDPVV